MIDLPRIIETPNGPMAEGSSPQLLRELLGVLDEELDRVGAGHHEWLRPGLDEATIRSTLASVGLRCPEELLVWFGWHNGTVAPPRPVRGRSLPNFSMGDLAGEVYVYQALLDFVPPPNPQDPDQYIDYYFGAGSGWLRLGDSNYGLVIECTESGGPPPRIRYANESFEYDPPEYYRAVSLCTYVTWWIFGLRNGGYVPTDHIPRWEVVTERLAATQRAALFW